MITPLAPRELEVLRLIAEGCTYQQIGDRMRISGYTVKQYLRSVYLKLYAVNAANAVHIAHREGLLDDE